MATGLRGVFESAEQLLRNSLFIRRGKNLPCDSKSAKLCFVCHLFRDKLTGSCTVSRSKRVVVFTKHGNYTINKDPDSQVNVHGNQITVWYGVKPDFFREK